MRKPLTTAVIGMFAGLCWAVGTPVLGRDMGGSAGADLPGDRAVPVRGSDVPVDALDVGGSRAFTLQPQVQAIPTPTAYSAGLVTLVAMWAVRRLGRRRRSA